MSAPAPTPSAHIEVTHLQNWREGVWEYEDEIKQDHHLLRLPLSRSKMTITSHGQVLHDGTVWPGMMRLVSPGERAHVIMHSRAEAVVLRLPGDILRSAIEATGGNHRPGKVCFVDGIYRPNFQVEQLGRSLVHIREFDPLHAQLYVGGVAHALLGCLLFHHGSGAGRGVRPLGLTTAEFELAADYASARMAEPLTLNGWAAVLGMSPPEFTKRFRATVGSSPYAWFMNRRIERAKELLRNPERLLCDVALTAGFSSQSHFTDAFRKRVGMPPDRWRQDLLR